MRDLGQGFGFVFIYYNPINLDRPFNERLISNRTPSAQIKILELQPMPNYRGYYLFLNSILFLFRLIYYNNYVWYNM